MADNKISLKMDERLRGDWRWDEMKSKWQHAMLLCMCKRVNSILSDVCRQKRQIFYTYTHVKCVQKNILFVVYAFHSASVSLLLANGI